MAPKPSRDMLIHCDACGEDYSSTYRRCPFCGERNDPRRPAPRQTYAPAPSSPARPPEETVDDTYVFDGQDAIDKEPEEEYYAPRPKGGKRLAPKQSGRGDLPPINWPRLITFLCSLILIVAALVIVFTFIYPKLHGKTDPKTDASDPGTESSSIIDLDPNAAASTDVTQPTVPTDTVIPTQPLEPVPELASITLDTYDFTLWVGEAHQLEVTFNPSSWNGQVTYTSSNPEWLTVNETGYVTNVNASGAYHNVYITVSAGGISAQCVVRVQSRRQDESAAQPTTSVTADPPAVTTQAPSGTGGPAVGRQGTIVNADGGLRVRSGPGTSYDIVESLLNGNTVNVVAEAENGWYQISFTGRGGATVNGYIMGEYISTN